MSDPLALARDALAGQETWLVGGALRDRLLGRPVVDVDLIVAGEPRAAARALARAADGPMFELSEAFGAWRVLAALAARRHHGAAVSGQGDVALAGGLVLAGRHDDGPSG